MTAERGHDAHEAARAHTDPVCGMKVDPFTARGSHTYAGTTYYFCSNSCLEKFRAAPDRYPSQHPGGQPAGAGVGAQEVLDPVCGMAVAPEGRRVGGV